MKQFLLCMMCLSLCGCSAIMHGFRSASVAASKATGPSFSVSVSEIDPGRQYVISVTGKRAGAESVMARWNKIASDKCGTVYAPSVSIVAATSVVSYYNAYTKQMNFFTVVNYTASGSIVCG